MKNTPSNQPTHEQITQRAHTIWIQAGRPEGQDLEHWIKAESELRKESKVAETISGSGAGDAGFGPSSAGKKPRNGSSRATGM